MLRCESGAPLDGERARFRFLGREARRALRYNPHALQIVAPSGDLLQSGVRVVLQLLPSKS